MTFSEFIQLEFYFLLGGILIIGFIIGIKAIGWIRKSQDSKRVYERKWKK